MSRIGVSINWCAEHVPAILEAWEPGMMGGLAVAEAFFGKVKICVDIVDLLTKRGKLNSLDLFLGISSSI